MTRLTDGAQSVAALATASKAVGELLKANAPAPIPVQFFQRQDDGAVYAHASGQIVPPPAPSAEKAGNK